MTPGAGARMISKLMMGPQNTLLVAAAKSAVDERRSQVEAADAADAALRATRAQNENQVPVDLAGSL